MSAEQRSMLFYDELFGLGVADNNVVAVEVPPDVGATAVGESLAVLVGRHAALRAALDRDASGRQVCAPASGEPVTVAHTVAPAEGAWIARRTKELAELRMDRHVPGLTHFELVDLGGARRVLLFTVDHLMSDGTSCDVLVDEFVRLVRATGSDRSASLAPLPLSYLDLCRARTSSPGLAARLRQEIEFWCRTLDGVGPSRGSDLGAAGTQGQRRIRYDLVRPDPDLYRRVMGLSRALHVTPFAVVATAAAIALWRRTGSRDTLLFTPVSTRRDPAMAHLVGNFVNDRPVACHVSPERTLAEQAQQVARSCLGALRHHQAAVPDLVEAVEPLRAALLTPGAEYVQLHVTVSDSDTAEEWEAPTAAWAPELIGDFTPGRAITCTTLRFSLEPARSWVKAFFGGPPSDAPRAAALGARVVRLLEAMVADGDQRVGELAGD
nr:condensation domain-containing protein [Planosporangium thailandense]